MAKICLVNVHFAIHKIVSLKKTKTVTFHFTAIQCCFSWKYAF